VYWNVLDPVLPGAVIMKLSGIKDRERANGLLLSFFIVIIQ
jgi:hypothetical protein